MGHGLKRCKEPLKEELQTGPGGGFDSGAAGSGTIGGGAGWENNDAGAAVSGDWANAGSAPVTGQNDWEKADPVPVAATSGW